MPGSRSCARDDSSSRGTASERQYQVGDTRAWSFLVLHDGQCCGAAHLGDRRGPQAVRFETADVIHVAILWVGKREAAERTLISQKKFLDRRQLSVIEVSEPDIPTQSSESRVAIPLLRAVDERERLVLECERGREGI